MSAARLRCLVPFCRRTLRDDGAFDEWICGKHWREVDKRLRRLYQRRARRWRRHRLERDGALAAIHWQACRAQAIARGSVVA